METLQDGLPAIVWAEAWSLPYNGWAADDGMWGSFPLVVYGYEPEQQVVAIADRARVPLTVTPAELAAARGRIKKDRYRLLTLEAPDEKKLGAAVQMGIHDTIRLFTELPPKGAAHNFGLRALQHWAQVLRQPALREAAERFRASGDAWRRLPTALLPDEVALFGEARELLVRRHRLFLEEGGAALPAMQEVDSRLAAIRAAMDDDFPLSPAQVVAHREAIAAQLDAIYEAERAAVEALQGTGQNFRQVKITSAEQIEQPALHALVEAAVEERERFLGRAAQGG